MHGTMKPLRETPWAAQGISVYEMPARVHSGFDVPVSPIGGLWTADSEDNALLLGSLLLFAMLAGVMYVTRRVDWYRGSAELVEARGTERGSGSDAAHTGNGGEAGAPPPLAGPAT